ncbi:MAG: Nif3-like dinuclear metal center hexameric protein, partial [Armatimonadetes bacterium]|nr:Nif3-like dinuclear metal center hexameric protein [Armatimonadota bacterium]
MKAWEIARLIEEQAPPRGSDEGFRFGSPNVEVSGVLVCWMCTLEAVRRAVEERSNLIVTHEELHYPYSFRSPGLEQHLTWPVNHARLTALAKHDITVYRAHGMLDRFCILDDFGRMLGLPEASVREDYYRVYDIDPVTVSELVQQVKAAT